MQRRILSLLLAALILSVLPLSSRSSTVLAGDERGVGLTFSLPFDVKLELLGLPQPLSVHVEQLDPGTGVVRANGGDAERSPTPFSWDWGDGFQSTGFFPQSHTYKDRTRNYVITVRARRANGQVDAAQTDVFFRKPGGASASTGQLGASGLTLSLPFDLKPELLGPPSFTSVRVEQVNVQTGEARLGGGTTPTAKGPFSWDWGDGSQSTGYFPQSHTYTDRSRDYLVTVRVRLADGGMDSTEILVLFRKPGVKAVPLPPEFRVSIPTRMLPLQKARLPGGGWDPKTTAFDDSCFPLYSRATVEYVLSAAAAIQSDLANGDFVRPNGAFRQVVLLQRGFPGMHSLWFTTPVAFVASEAGMGVSPGWSSFFHEMGHNVTLNSPARYISGPGIGGSGNAIFSEMLAQVMQHATGVELVNNYEKWGLSPEIAFDVRRDVRATAGVLRRAYDDYLKNGKRFSSWNDLRTQNDDEASGTFLTLGYKFCAEVERGGNGYRVPTQRLMRVIQLWNPDFVRRFAANENRPDAAEFRSTLMVAAVSHAVAKDLRAEFRQLNFPIDDQLYQSLLQRAGGGN